MTHEELETLTLQLQKRVEVLEQTNDFLTQQAKNFNSELFLDEAMAEYPDKTIRKRTTIKGTVKIISTALIMAGIIKPTHH